MLRFPAMPHSDRSPARAPRPPAWRRLGALLGFAALSAHLLLPLVYTCRTYKVRVPSCCSGGPVAALARVQTGLAAGQTCPFCTAISPFKHARSESAPHVEPQAGSLFQRTALPPIFVPLREEPTSNLPRAPPFLS